MATLRSTSVTLVVFDEVMYRGNGIVKRWMDLVAERFEANAFRFCPKRTGDLASTIEMDVATTGPRQCEATISVGGPRAPYADFVMRGTSGPIMSDKAWDLKAGFRFDMAPGYLMPLPPWNDHRGGLYYEVGGQTANNFLFKAWDATARQHPAIRRNASSAHLAL